MFICVNMCRQFVFAQGGPEEGVGFAGIGAIGSCKMPCGCWGLNWGPVEEQSALCAAEPSLQPWSPGAAISKNAFIIEVS